MVETGEGVGIVDCATGISWGGGWTGAGIACDAKGDSAGATGTAEGKCVWEIGGYPETGS